jgi:hypothetical protein
MEQKKSFTQNKYKIIIFSLPSSHFEEKSKKKKKNSNWHSFIHSFIAIHIEQYEEGSNISRNTLIVS